MSRPRAALGDITNNIPRGDSNKLTRKPSIFSSRSNLLPAVNTHSENTQQNQQSSATASVATSATCTVAHVPIPAPTVPVLRSSRPSSRLATAPPPPPVAAATASAAPAEEDRSYMRREIDDIDFGEDASPINLCSNYAEQMYDYFFENEQVFLVNSSYLTSHRHINESMRSVLIDWIAEVHFKFKLASETLYLTVNIIDRYLEQVHDITTSKLQLIGVTALLLASKVEDIYPPELKELAYITSSAYTTKDIIQMESQIAGVLNFNFTVPTVYTFISRFLKAAHADKMMVQTACYLAERSLQEYAMLQFPPSVIAAQCIRSARMMTNRYPWSPTLRKYCRLDEADLVPCGEVMRRYMELDESNAQAAVAAAGARRNQKVAIRNKYSRSRLGCVAQLPLLF
jgi:G2/mitotic-specific cyclin-B, other